MLQKRTIFFSKSNLNLSSSPPASGYVVEYEDGHFPLAAVPMTKNRTAFPAIYCSCFSCDEHWLEI